MTVTCALCNDEAWVCEQHTDRGWPDADPGCAGPGMPCPSCNDPDDPVFGPGTVEVLRLQ